MERYTAPESATGRGSLNVLFVCTGNAGRSQMAHAVFAQQCGARIRVDSAGVDPWPALHPLALSLMTERGISMEGHSPKGVDAVDLGAMDVVVTIGDRARDEIPAGRISAAHWIHWDIADPADADDTPAAEMTFRATLYAIESLLPQLSQYLTRSKSVASVRGYAGITTGLWGHSRFRPAAHLSLARRVGFRVMELDLYRGDDHFDWHSASAVGELQHVTADLGMAIWSLHLPKLPSIISGEADQQRLCRDVLERCVDLAVELGARVLVSHALIDGTSGGDGDVCEERIAAFLDDVETIVSPTPVRVGFENSGDTAVADTSLLLARLAQRSPAACGFVLDSGHMQLENGWKEVGAGLGGRLVSLHLNDNDASVDAHLPPLDGTIDWRGVRELIARSEYRGPAIYKMAPHSDATLQLKRTMEAHRHLFAGEAK